MCPTRTPPGANGRIRGRPPSVMPGLGKIPTPRSAGELRALPAQKWLLLAVVATSCGTWHELGVGSVRGRAACPRADVRSAVAVVPPPPPHVVTARSCSCRRARVEHTCLGHPFTSVPGGSLGRKRHLGVHVREDVDDGAEIPDAEADATVQDRAGERGARAGARCAQPACAPRSRLASRTESWRSLEPCAPKPGLLNRRWHDSASASSPYPLQV